MPEGPHVERSFIATGSVEPGPGGLTTPSLNDLIEFAIVNQWSGGSGFYRVGVSVQDKDDVPVPIVVGDEAVVRHTVAYDFQPNKPPLRQYLDVEMRPRDWGEVFVCLDVNGVEVHRYPVRIVRAA